MIPRGALVRYREWYGRGAKPNEGPKLTAEAVARGILGATRASPSPMAWPTLRSSPPTAGPIGERMFREGLSWRRADNARVARAGAMGGWDQMRARILGDGDGPGLVVFATCLDFIRTVPRCSTTPRARRTSTQTRRTMRLTRRAMPACPGLTRPRARRRRRKRERSAR